MAKRARVQTLLPEGVKTSVPVVLPARQVHIDAEGTVYYPRTVQKRTGRNYFRSVPLKWIDAARSLGFPLESRQTKHGKYLSIRLFCQTKEQADRDFKAIFARIKRRANGFPDVLKVGNNLPEPTKTEERQKRKQREKDAQESIYLARLESMADRFTLEEIDERLKRIRETSPPSLVNGRIAALSLARLQALEKRRRERVGK